MSPEKSSKSIININDAQKNAIMQTMINHFHNTKGLKQTLLKNGYTEKDINKIMQEIAKILTRKNYQYSIQVYLKKIIDDSFNDVSVKIPQNTKIDPTYRIRISRDKENIIRRTINTITLMQEKYKKLHNERGWLTIDMEKTRTDKDKYMFLKTNQKSKKAILAEEALTITLSFLTYKDAKIENETDDNKKIKDAKIDNKTDDNKKIEEKTKEIQNTQDKLKKLEKNKKKNKLLIILSVITPICLISALIVSILLFPMPISLIAIISSIGAISFTMLPASLIKKKDLKKEEEKLKQIIEKNQKDITLIKTQATLNTNANQSSRELKHDKLISQNQKTKPINIEYVQYKETDNINSKYEAKGKTEYETKNKKLNTQEKSNDNTSTTDISRLDLYNNKYIANTNTGYDTTSESDELEYETADEGIEPYTTTNKSKYETSDEAIDLSKKSKTTNLRTKNRTSYQTIDSENLENNSSEQEYPDKESTSRSIKEKRRLNDNISITSIKQITQPSSFKRKNN